MKRNRKKIKLQAFTLIELLLAIAIVLVMSALGLSFLSTSKRENNLKTAQREVASTIKLAQSYTLQGKYISTGSFSGTPCGFGFRFTDDDSYEIFYILPSGSNNCTVKNDIKNSASLRICEDSGSSLCKVLESYSLKNNVKLNENEEEIERNTTVYYTVPHANVFNYAGEAYSGYELKLKTVNSENKVINVNSFGSVSEE